MKLRDYQQYAVDAVFDYWKGGGGNPIICMPTGTGKSAVIAGMIQRLMKGYPAGKVLMLTHVKELIAQNASAIKRMWRQAPVGIYSAGLKRKEGYMPITCAGVASLAKNPDAVGQVDLVIIDECHLVNNDQAGMYHKLYQHLLEKNEHLRVVGLTATPYRMRGGMLTEGWLFDDVPVNMSSLDAFNWFIDEGYLVDLVSKRTEEQINVEGVRIAAGEYNQKDLQEAVDRDEITRHAIDEVMEYGKSRKKWLVFASGIAHAEHVKEEIERRGIACHVVHSRMKANDRDRVIEEFKAGNVRAIVNNGILTTGFDDPEIDMIVMLRPTRSPALWVQMLGRGTRPVYAGDHDLTTTAGRLASIEEGGKTNCLVLDFAGNTKRLGPINDPVIPQGRKGKGGGAAPVRECPNCHTVQHVSIRACKTCGYVWPIKNKLKARADAGEIVARKGPDGNWLKVKLAHAEIMEARNGKRYVRLNFRAAHGAREYWASLSLFPEHSEKAQQLCRRWLGNLKAGEPEEMTAEGVLKALDGIRAPEEIMTEKDGKWRNVKSVRGSGIINIDAVYSVSIEIDNLMRR